MSQDIVNAAVMLLRSRALESYGVIKDCLRRPAAEGYVDKIASMSLKLAQYEGAMLTLQQYAESLLEAPPEDEEVSEEEEGDEDEEKPMVVTPEQSPTLRRSLKNTNDESDE